MHDAELLREIERRIAEKVKRAEELRSSQRSPDPDAKRISLEAIRRAHPSLKT